jgi:hypothetical protein
VVLLSNRSEGMDVYVFILRLCCPLWVAALRRADPPVQGILPTVYRIKTLKKLPRPKKVSRAINNEKVKAFL